MSGELEGPLDLLVCMRLRLCRDVMGAGWRMVAWVCVGSVCLFESCTEMLEVA